MREIEFRVRDNGQWYYGLPLRITDTNVQFQGIDENGKEVYSVFCERETLGQYTGRTDKNGKKIFEGDIVKDITGGIYKVVYDAEYMRFAFDDGIKWGLEGFVSLNDFEVIGNAFDNPELLGGEND